MKNIWDKLGMAISITCLIHCLAMPIIPFVLPLHFNEDNPLVPQIFFVLVVISAFMAFYPHRKNQQAKNILIIAVSSVVLIGLSIFVVYPYWGHDLEGIFTLVGSFLLVFAHYKNLRLCRGMKHNHL